MSRHNLGEKNMNDKYIKQIRKALNEILGLYKLGYDFEIHKGLYEEDNGMYIDGRYIDGFFVVIDYDFWKDEKHKKQTFIELRNYFPRIQYCEDEVLAHIPFGFDNFGEINA